MVFLEVICIVLLFSLTSFVNGLAELSKLSFEGNIGNVGSLFRKDDNDWGVKKLESEGVTGGGGT